jgi:hypothetical protein
MWRRRGGFGGGAAWGRGARRLRGGGAAAEGEAHTAAQVSAAPAARFNVTGRDELVGMHHEAEKYSSIPCSTDLT